MGIGISKALWRSRSTYPGYLPQAPSFAIFSVNGEREPPKAFREKGIIVQLVGNKFQLEGLLPSGIWLTLRNASEEWEFQDPKVIWNWEVDPMSGNFKTPEWTGYIIWRWFYSIQSWHYKPHGITSNLGSLWAWQLATPWLLRRQLLQSAGFGCSW